MTLHLPYQYDTVVDRIVDGDTAYLYVVSKADIGFEEVIEATRKKRIRLGGIDTPERFTKEGKAATAALTKFITGWSVTLCTAQDKTEKYGRYLAWLWVGNVCINDNLVTDGYAVRDDYGHDLRPADPSL